MGKVLIVYDTYSGHTEEMARAVAQGAGSVPGVTVVTQMVTTIKPQELAEADLVALGSPTHYGHLSYEMTIFLGEVSKQGVPLKGKLGAAFGSYGFTSEGVPILNRALESLGVKLASPGLTILRRPTPQDLEACRQFGRELAEKALDHGTRRD